MTMTTFLENFKVDKADFIIYDHVSSSQQRSQVGCIILPILEMRKVNLRGT